MFSGLVLLVGSLIGAFYFANLDANPALPTFISDATMIGRGLIITQIVCVISGAVMAIGLFLPSSDKR